MAIIKKLSSHEAQKIAAGEVVERPASVIKELIENSVDAGAQTIILSIFDGGKKLIKIIDDGCGMSKEDARLCIEKHATSKLVTFDDLVQLQTFGFRGEALASITAVARVVIITRHKDELQGYQIEVERGQIIQESEVAAPIGTTIEVHELFCTVPARQKFLKKKETETRHIQQLVYACSLQYQELSLQFYVDERLIFGAHRDNEVIQCCAAVWNIDDSTQLIPVKFMHKTNTISVKGIITSHQHMRYDRSGIYLFVNNRWVKNQSLSRAVIRGYQNVLPSQRYPSVYLAITVDVNDVDINVHPRKEEVQFVHQRRVERCIQDAIKLSLEKNVERHIKNIQQQTQAGAVCQQDSFTKQPLPLFDPFMQVSNSFTDFYHKKTNNTFDSSSSQQVVSNIVFNQISTPIKNCMINNDEQEQCVVIDKDTFTIIGQYNKTYILLHTKDGLAVVDQHAAHERILYEKFKSRFAQHDSIPLLFPEVVTLSPNDATCVQDNYVLFSDHGVILDCIGENTFAVKAVPSHIKHLNFEDLIKKVVFWINEVNNLSHDEMSKYIHEKVHAQMACKAAVKAGDELNYEKMNQLINDLYVCDNKLTCPHGRPTMWLITLSELEKKFKRKL
jgi:DNA mismatch repair protein MutL